MKIQKLSTFVSVPAHNTQNSPLNNKCTTSPISFNGRIGTSDYSLAKCAFIEIIAKDYKNPLKALMQGRIGILDIVRNRKNYAKFAGKKSYEFAHEHKWTNDELEKIEGLQKGLPAIEHMNMKQIHFLLGRVHEANLIWPIVRGCNHRCAYCYLDAKAPIKRMSFEDFSNSVDDLSEMTERMLFKTNNRSNKNTMSVLFYDSDGSELYLLDKSGKKHEFPELNSMIYDLTGSKGLFDTAGWNPKNKEAQARMERLVNYYAGNKRELNKIMAFNVSINPFEGLYDKAVQHIKKGNFVGYEKLKNLYIDMVVNTLDTFTPLINEPQFRILCRAYPDRIEDEAFQGYKVLDVKKLKAEIISKYILRHKDELNKSPDIITVLDRKFKINQDMIAPGGRDNKFKEFVDQRAANSYEQYSKAKNLKLYAQKQNMSVIDINGKFYTGDDYNLFQTDLRLNYENPIEKPIKPHVFPDVIKFR